MIRMLIRSSRTTALLGLACVLVSAGGLDLVTRWKDGQTREQICRDWNADDSDEQFYVSGLDNSRIHVVVHGALAADADEILDGLTSTPGFTPRTSQGWLCLDRVRRPYGQSTPPGSKIGFNTSGTPSRIVTYGKSGGLASMGQSHAATILADQIKKWMRPYVVPAEILDNLTTAEVLELRAMSRAMKKENPQAYAGGSEIPQSTSFEHIKDEKRESDFCRIHVEIHEKVSVFRLLRARTHFHAADVRSSSERVAQVHPVFSCCIIPD